MIDFLCVLVLLAVVHVALDARPAATLPLDPAVHPRCDDGRDTADHIEPPGEVATK